MYLKCLITPLALLAVIDVAIAQDVAPSTESAPAPAPPDMPAGANLVVYRQYAQPTAWMPTVKMDGIKIVALPNRHYTAAKVPPGKHKVTLSWPLLSGQHNATMEIDVVEGSRHYVEVTGISQYAGGGFGVMYFNMGSGIAEVRPEHAEKTLATCCKFKAAKE